MVAPAEEPDGSAQGAGPSAESTPLIVSGRAARRLKLLFGQGVDLAPRIQEACERRGVGQDADERRAAAGEAACLAAALLHRTVAVPEEEPCLQDACGPSWLQSRDLQLELAVTTNTLRRLQLPSGTIVSVSNPAEPGVAPHVARVLALPAAGEEGGGVAPEDGVAYLSPGLAHNLGLALHLRPLLAGSGTAASVHVALRRLGGASDDHVAPLPQPVPEAAEVALADEVHIAVVRTPEVAVLPQAGGRPEDGAAGPDADGGDGAAAPVPAAGDAALDVVADVLRRHLASATRVVCEGDVFAAPKERSDGLAKLLSVLNRPPPAQAAGPGGEQRSSRLEEELEHIHFKVMRLSARGSAAAAIDVNSTAVRMVGTCSAGLPVGLSSYLSTASRAADAAGSPVVPIERGLPSLAALLPTWRHVAELLASVLHPSSARLPLRLAILLHGPAGGGKRRAVATAAAAVGCHLVPLSCHDLRAPSSSDKQALGALRAAFEAAAAYRPVVLSLQHFESIAEGSHDAGSFTAKAAAVLSECILEGCQQDGVPVQGGHPAVGARNPLVLVACTDAVGDIPASLRRCFTHEIEVDAPDRAQRRLLIESSLGGAAPEAALLDDAAQHTAGLLPRELVAVAADACALAVMEEPLAPAVLSAADAPAPRGRPTLSKQHLTAALEAARKRMSTDIGAPAIPNVTWQDVGGLEAVKRSILDTVELPLKHPVLFARGLRRRSGVLLYGPPGTGKTLLAKAVATECSINFLSVKGPELINMYVGESERQIREVFARARQARPCVVFFDELDSLAPARGKGSDSGGVMDRVVSQLLAEIDGMQAGGGASDVFIIGATNRPDLLDAAMLRPGRLDKLLYVGIAEDAGSREQVLRALTRKFALHEGVDLPAVAAACPARFTGADMYALSADAWMVAFRRGIAAREAAAARGGGEGAADGGDGGGDGDVVVVAQADFSEALRHLQPSLSEEEVLRYEMIRAQYEAS